MISNADNAGIWLSRNLLSLELTPVLKISHTFTCHWICHTRSTETWACDLTNLDTENTRKIKGRRIFSMKKLWKRILKTVIGDHYKRNCYVVVCILIVSLKGLIVLLCGTYTRVQLENTLGRKATTYFCGVRWFVGCMKPAMLIGGMQEWLSLSLSLWASV